MDVISWRDDTDTITGLGARDASDTFYSVHQNQTMLIHQSQSGPPRRWSYKIYRLIQALKMRYSLHGKNVTKYFYLELAITDGGECGVGMNFPPGGPDI
jgi:hypothetical protein